MEKLKKLTYSQNIVLAFLLLAIVGSLLLSCPIASKTGQWTPFLNSLFTSISALCVTGLVVYDTFSHWSYFGQAIILILIQIGGVGFMTIITSLSLILKRKVGLHERQLLLESSGFLHSSNLIKLIRRILLFVFIIEGVGAVLLSIRFIPEFGWSTGIYYGVFHSISAFCNAGFDLFGNVKAGSSLTSYVSDPLISLTVCLLIILGSLGFMVWEDLLRHKFNAKEYSFHTKIVLFMSISLLIIGWISFYLLENQQAMKNLSDPNKLIASLFLSVSPRTAGFSIIPLDHLSSPSLFLTFILMNIGGASGSTSGGLKVTTFAILLFSAISSAQRKPTVSVFKRRFDNETIQQTSALLTFYLIIGLSGSFVLSALNNFPIEKIVFEVFSALGTAGFSLGFSAHIHGISKLIIILFMFIGRVGWMVLIFSLVGTNKKPPVRRVSEKILVG
ncbi:MULTISPECIES: TrkH family potassium uptake protein [unclassified Lactococcus]|uniref:TrkH family potassium uptake protein n=1 Tax=unclassified Lactococcus TaxID=2643510 RepID=UPI0011CAF64A|nr:MULTISPECIES: TrkH family potassium uptake protein [unclassified Lactococcus]MQW22921.1 Trk family potassium uptake protein [Lactococcus sp. dk101]TXK44532.1 Trk family potassium uptake protein [Lactococcus sp. dk310]TXK50385.1 Trk family potassium uptake protein [Lactococcus sp. dk322]